MKRSAAIIALIVTAAAATPSRAQDYPSRPIRALTTTSAGGISDIFMRALGDELHKRWGQPIVVENRPGGMQNVGTRACAEAPPDGYTVCIINADPLVYNQFLLKNMPFDPEKGLQPITNLYHLIQMLVVNATLEDQDDRRTRRVVEGESRHLELCHGVARRSRSTWRRSGKEQGRGLGAGAVQGRRRGGQCGAERIDADRAHRRGQCHRPDQGRHDDAAGHGQQHQVAELPRRADHGRDRLYRRTVAQLVRVVRPAPARRSRSSTRSPRRSRASSAIPRSASAI